MANEKFLQSRQISERWQISGRLELLSPTHFGGRNSNSMLDMPLLLDPVDGSALLPGTSLAGALRNYLCIRTYGYARSEPPGSLGESLFGYQRGEDGDQSWLIIDDAYSAAPLSMTRDGIARDPRTGTAADKKKFDFETLAPGTVFEIHLELMTPANLLNDLLLGLGVALQGLERGEIHLGGRKSRGLGHCQVKEWQVTRYRLNELAGLESYLRKDSSGAKSAITIGEAFHQHLAEEFDPKALDGIDVRRCFMISADFAIRDSILIRSGGEHANDPDHVHLTWQNADGSQVPILSGSSLAGALRQRARRILNQLGGDHVLIDRIFGNTLEQGRNTSSMERRKSSGAAKTLPTGSRLRVSESEVKQPAEKLVQNRIKLDRFTGGVMTGALFNMQPVFARKEKGTTVNLTMQLIESEADPDFNAGVGLLLHLLKDLWLGDLPIGGEVSIGRGRLDGLSATLSHQGKSWVLRSDPDGSMTCEPETGFGALERYSQAFEAHCKRSSNG